jgi:serine protease
MTTSTKNVRLLLLPALAAALIGTGTQAAAAPRTDNTDRIIVKFKDQASTIGKNGLPAFSMRSGGAKAASLYFKHQMGGGGAFIYKLNGPQPLAEVTRIAAELMQNDDIEYAEPDARRYPQFVPGDTDYLSQWYMHDSETAGGIFAESAWDITTGDTNVVIAVLDTGITTHSDITRVLAGYDFISDSDIANDSNGRDNDPADTGDAVIADECGLGEDASNSSWHGTLVSGVIAADVDADGIAGLNHMGSILPVRVLGKCGGFTSDIADAIRWAAGLSISGVPDNTTPAHVINLSLGGTGSCSQTEQNAINAAVTAGSTIVAAAGNEGDTSISSPANCQNVIAVAATTREGGETCYTNVDTKVDISAPGGNSDEPTLGCTSAVGDGIHTTSNAGADAPGAENYDEVIGTSLSTPMVSGAIGLMVARAINNAITPLTPAEVEAILKNTARTFPTGTLDSFRDCTISNCGAGILDIDAALNYIDNLATVDTIPDAFSFTNQSNVTPGSIVASNTVTITGINAAANVAIDGGEYSIDGGAFTSTAGSINNNQTIQVRQTASASRFTSGTAVLMVGGFTENFTIRTVGINVPNFSPSDNDDDDSGGGFDLWLLLISFYMLRRRIFPAGSFRP